METPKLERLDRTYYPRVRLDFRDPQSTYDTAIFLADICGNFVARETLSVVERTESHRKVFYIMEKALIMDTPGDPLYSIGANRENTPEKIFYVNCEKIGSIAHQRIVSKLEQMVGK